MRQAIDTEGPVVLDVQVRKEENCYPMIPAAPRQGTWWADGRAGNKEVLRLEDLEAAGNRHTGRKHVLSVLVENKPGVLTRISGLFARRGFNIDTLAVGPTDDESVSRMTIVLTAPLTRSTRSPSSCTSWST